MGAGDGLNGRFVNRPYEGDEAGERALPHRDIAPVNGAGNPPPTMGTEVGERSSLMPDGCTV